MLVAAGNATGHNANTVSSKALRGRNDAHRLYRWGKPTVGDRLWPRKR